MSEVAKAWTGNPRDDNSMGPQSNHLFCEGNERERQRLGADERDREGEGDLEIIRGKERELERKIGG